MTIGELPASVLARQERDVLEIGIGRQLLRVARELSEAGIGDDVIASGLTSGLLRILAELPDDAADALIDALPESLRKVRVTVRKEKARTRGQPETRQ